MKKIISFILAAMMLLTLVACSGDPAETDGSANNGNETSKTPADTKDDGNKDDTAAAPVFVFKGVTISMNAPSDPIIEAIGEPSSTYEQPSCAFQGNDIYYNYGSIEISAYEEGGERRVYSVFVKDDLVTTPEGLYIGSSEADAFAVYGEDSRTSSGNIIYHGKGVDVTVVFTDGKVSSIEYVATFEG